MKPTQKRDGRIDDLYNRAIRKKYTKDGIFLLAELVKDAIKIGVSKATGQSYADEVIVRLQKKGYLA